jgi:hypothetical protein
MADWLYESLYEYTPMLKNGEAEFYFIANDATDSVISHLKSKGYKYFEQRNEILPDDQLFKMGYAWPEYIHRVYRGYNRAILEARGQIVVLINSDHYFSHDWLENLLKFYDTQKIVCSQLVEPQHPKFGIYQSAIHGEFGNTIGKFDKDSFISFAKKIRKTGVYYGGAYMPCMFNKDFGIYAGLYPEGNLAGNSFDEISKTGDEAFFEHLSNNGITHITSMDSIVYHLKEGEKDDEGVLISGKQNYIKGIDTNTYKRTILPMIKINSFRLLIQPICEHSEIMNKLLGFEPKKITMKERAKSFSEKYLPLSVNRILHLVWNFVRNAHWKK